MKNVIASIWNNHLLPFVGYLAAFFSPISVIVITLQVVVWGQLATSWAAWMKNKSYQGVQTFAAVLVKTGMYVFLLLILRVCELEVLKGIPVAKVLGGYWVIRELKVNLDNVSVVVGHDLWGEIMKVVNKIKI